MDTGVGYPTLAFKELIFAGRAHLIAASLLTKKPFMHFLLRYG